MPDTLKLLLHNLQLLVLKIVMKLVSAGQPLLFSGPGSSLRMCRAMADLGARKVLIVTGAAQGIGRGVAQAVCAEGGGAMGGGQGGHG